MSVLFKRNFPLKILLASTSIYRKNQLNQLGYLFENDSPICDENHFKLKEKNPVTLSKTLSLEKAKSLYSKYPDYLIIGADQVCHLENKIFSKPENFENAKSQLIDLQGKKHILSTSYSLLLKELTITHTDQTLLSMRNLSVGEIESYLLLDAPYSCAGSYMYEKNGFKLFTAIESNDPSSIIGLPLLSLQTHLIQLAKEHDKDA